ncbi:hypothetical protein [Comamonas sp.]|uniref:hypothetical protein n=1 Tax=Comamonas sp. TaxID=34028 RepID=UPI00289E6825|nr:hypothetical protein [Comamonas sp.]
MTTCYLDSQDYSVLTDPKFDDANHRQIREALLHLARSKQVRFVFSATAVCESVALTADSGHLAELKAELLSELCGSNALISLDRLVEAEIRALARRCLNSGEMIDSNGRWFPDIPIEKNPVSRWETLRELAEEEMKTMGLSRQQRRAKTRMLIKNGKPRSAFNALLAQQDSNAFVTEILQKYPMHPRYAGMMANYALGRATEQDFSEALMGSLTDPRWMMKWFTSEHSLSSPISDIVRKPGREMGHLIRSLVEISAKWVISLQESGIDSNPTGKGGVIWNRWQEMEAEQTISITQRLASAIGVEPRDYGVKEVSTFCPGLTTVIRSLYSSVWANVGEGRKEAPSDSQPVDAMHAFYAPYVQVFRADRFMAPHIQKQVRDSGTIVVPRLAKLVETLDECVR